MSGEDRPGGLDLVVPDSGRTVLAMYQDLDRMNPNDLLIGDVLIVRHQTAPGTMFMQVTECKPATAEKRGKVSYVALKMKERT